MKYSKRVEIFEKVRTRYAEFLASILWKLTGDRELFTEALQYSLLEMWRHIEKLNSKKAAAYIYRIALTANSKAWRNRIGSDGQISQSQIDTDEGAVEKVADSELAGLIRATIAQLPARQARAIVMRYLEQQEYKAIAETLRCSEAGVRSNVSKAMATLRYKLANLTKQE